MTIRLRSRAFADGQPIPSQFSRDGDNVSPPLQIENLPPDTEEVVLIAYDPDAPRDDPWVHWLLYNLDPSIRSIPEGIPVGPKPADPRGARQGLNTSGEPGYEGPAPPPGDGQHRYHFRVYALDRAMDLEPGTSAEAVLQTMMSHVVDHGELIGTYERR